MTTPAPVPVRVLGGPTTLIEYAGLRLLTDPTFDEPQTYENGGLPLTKTAPSPVQPDQVVPVDAVLLSHDEHPDNLDLSGRAFLAQAPIVLTTPSGSTRLADQLGDKVRGLAPWSTHELTAPDGTTVTVTGLPAQHGPDGSLPVVGEVVGFLLTANGHPTVYVSGDNASLDVVHEIANRVGKVDTAVIHAGAVRTPLFDGALLTVDSALAAEAAQILDASHVVGAHTDSWAHFTETREQLEAAFQAAGIGERLQRN